jgi:ABC-type bacteriocin/lantibiotic exporter with double-glycine peptidase domain
MPNSPLLYPQETDYSCVPACIRTVLGHFGVLMTEEEAANLCGCTVEGTGQRGLEKAARVLRENGFPGTTVAQPGIDELRTELDRGNFPIVFIKTRATPLAVFRQLHAVVIAEIGESVCVLDPAPARGEQTILLDAFLEEWELARRITLVIRGKV